LLRTDRQVADQYVDLGRVQGGDHVDRLGLGLGDGLAVVLAETVEGVTALDGDTGRRHVQILIVLFSLAPIASARSRPTFLPSTSKAATNSTSLTW